jgi:3'-5' exoribonuclease
MASQLGIEAAMPANGSAANGDGPRIFIRDLADGQRVTGAFVVRGRERRQKKDGSDWLNLVLADRTGRVTAKLWEGVDEVFELCAAGCIVFVDGRYSIHERFGKSLTLRAIRAADDGEYDRADLLDTADTPVERLEGDLRDLISTIQNRHLAVLLERFFGERSRHWQRFREAPAAKFYHQAYRHGLLDHSLSVAQAVSAAAGAFPGIDRDVAVTGALLHDIGKTQAYNDDPLAIDLTDDGRLLGEIPLGYYLVRREIESIEGFPPPLARAILHIILSHHGKLEQGSPVVPATREATLVHAIDNLGGTLGSFDRIERALPEGQAWSGFDRGIDSSAYFLSRAA